MTNIEIKIKEPLCSIFKDDDFDHFTVTQLNALFMKEIGNTLTVKQARVLVYKQILRLLKKSLILKDSSIKGARNAIYSKTPLFHESLIVPFGEYISTVHNTPQNNQHENLVINSLREDAIDSLKEQLKGDKVDLISSISESEEYLRLIEIFPQAKEHLQIQFLNASERSSKLLGKIRATKSFLIYLSEEQNI